MKKYIVCSGEVISKRDGQKHFITSRQLIDLYKVNPRECIFYDPKNPSCLGGLENSLIFLHPREDGDYSLT